MKILNSNEEWNLCNVCVICVIFDRNVLEIVCRRPFGHLERHESNENSKQFLTRNHQLQLNGFIKVLINKTNIIVIAGVVVGEDDLKDNRQKGITY